MLHLLAEIAEQVSNCSQCDLCQGRNKAVPGEGNPKAEIMFIGEAPGREEDKQGRPFVGAAGKFLDEMLASIGLKRADVYITNLVKCRPPGNRDPLPAEIAACHPYLAEQIKQIKPKLFVLLGRHAMGHFLGPKLKISQEHGKLKRVGDNYYFILYHPASALYQNKLRDTHLADFKQIPLVLEKLKAIH